MPKPTAAQVARVRHAWTRHAGETIRIQPIGGAWYAFGSELACLRLYYKMKVGRAEYSTNMATWYYCNE